MENFQFLIVFPQDFLLTSLLLQRQRDRPAEPMEHDREAAGPEQVCSPEPDQQRRAQDTVGVTISGLVSKSMRLKLSDFDVVTVTITNVRFARWRMTSEIMHLICNK